MITIVFRAVLDRPHRRFSTNQAAFLKSQIIHGIQELSRRTLKGHVKQPDGHPGDINPYLHAAWKLRDALPLAISIDNLLDAYREDKWSEICGKLGIVSSILEAERLSKIYCRPTEMQKINLSQLSETWFTGFVKILTENVAKSEVSGIFENVAILSFNYDRCVEHYLHEALQVYYSLDANAVTTLMQTVKILHPYGSVGKLPWQESALRVPFGAERINILSPSKQIKTFNEKELMKQKKYKKYEMYFSKQKSSCFWDLPFIGKI